MKNISPVSEYFISISASIKMTWVERENELKTIHKTLKGSQGKRGIIKSKSILPFWICG